MVYVFECHILNLNKKMYPLLCVCVCVRLFRRCVSSGAHRFNCGLNATLLRVGGVRFLI